MNVEIEASPAFAFGRIEITPGGEAKVEAGAMAAMSGDVEIETKATGGLMGGLKRSVLGGESFFVNTFRSPGGGHVAVAAKLPGDMRLLPLEGATWLVQSGSWIASDAGVSVDTKWGGAKTFFGGEGLFLLKCAGEGDVLVSSYGAILEQDIPAGQSYVIDTGHVVAFQEGIQFGVEKAGSWKSSILGAEGLVVRFQGPGTVWLQTRSTQDLVGWLKTQLPANRS